jgi:hypothetical protein
MDKEHLNTHQEIRKILIERLVRLSFTEAMLEKMSLCQLAALLQLMAGHYGNLPGYVITVRTLEELFGEAIWEKPEKELEAEEPPVPVVVN